MMVGIGLTTGGLSMRFALSFVLLGLVGAGMAQDTRTVVEPKIPAVCVALPAELHAKAGVLSDGDEAKLDTGRIQHAIDACAKGHGVVLRASGGSDTFLSGPLELREGVTLVVEKGVTLLASRDPKVYETAAGSCGIVNDAHGSGCRPLIAVRGVKGAGVMGDGTIDGRGGQKLLGGAKSWWDLAEDARPNGRQQVPRLIVADHADDFTLYRITLKNSPNFHVTYSHGDGFTVWGLKIDTPKRLARNTDGVDPGGSKNITITQSFIRTGDDDVAIKGGEAITQMTVIHNHFYWGHGMSIGSETNGGVSKILVRDLSLDGPDSGIRIKSMGSRGGLVDGVTYDDVCIRDSPRPIDITAAYAANGPVKGNSPPTFENIVLHDVRVSGGGKILLEGYDHEHRAGVTLDGVVVDGGEYKYSVSHADVKVVGGTNLQVPSGEDSTVTGAPGKGGGESCGAKFVAFPVD
jgi:polygalacturonase